MSGRARKFSLSAAALLALVWLALGTAALPQSKTSSPEPDKRREPDFDLYAPPQVLTNADLGLDRPGARVILIGDIHGMNASLHELLDKLHFDPARDTLMPTGDMLTKASDAGGAAVLAFLARHKARGVRGNQDQPVVRWRAWQEWIAGLDARGVALAPNSTGAPAFDDAELDDDDDEPEYDDDDESDYDDEEEGEDDDDDDPAALKTLTGARWLARLDASYARWAGDRDRWVRRERRRGPRAWWARVPSKWHKTLQDDAYRLARAMPPDDAAYLRGLPSIIYMPGAHAFVAHAGLLAYDPKRPTDDRRQPLARAPPLRDREQQRTAQELGLLTAVPQNVDPWTPLHLRAVRRDGSLAKNAAKGTYWAQLWTRTMERCAGFDARPRAEKARAPLPCVGSAIVYGHTASFGLDVRRWSVGLDTGCVYGRKLTALVLDARSLAVGPRKRAAEERALRGGQVVFSTDDSDGEGEGDDVDYDYDDDGDDAPGTLRAATTAPEWVRFGERGSARLVSVKCPRPPKRA